MCCVEIMMRTDSCASDKIKLHEAWYAIYSNGNGILPNRLVATQIDRNWSIWMQRIKALRANSDLWNVCTIWMCAIHQLLTAPSHRWQLKIAIEFCLLNIIKVWCFEARHIVDRVLNKTKNMTTKSKALDPLNEECMGYVTEVGQQAVWSLSSCKPGTHNFTFVFFPRSNNPHLLTRQNRLFSLSVCQLNTV